MTEINLLSSIPKPRRSISERKEAKTQEHINISRMYGQEYFDGPREFGYGGYKYDGRWISVAKDIIKHFHLAKGQKVLDIGCAKGFLVKDLVDLGIVERDPFMRLKLCQFGGSIKIVSSKPQKKGFQRTPSPPYRSPLTSVNVQ